MHACNKLVSRLPCRGIYSPMAHDACTLHLHDALCQSQHCLLLMHRAYISVCQALCIGTMTPVDLPPPWRCIVRLTRGHHAVHHS